jgi:HAMP domain-containing protein
MRRGGRLVFKKLSSLGTKLPAMMIGLSAAMIFFVGAAAYFSVADELAGTARKSVETAVASEVTTLSRGIEALRSQLFSQANNAFAATAIEELTKWVEIGEGDRKSIGEYYRNPSANAQERIKLTGEGHRHGFSWRHLPVHQSYMPMQRLFGYQDVILISEAGRVVYTINKGNEFIEKLDAPAWTDTGPGRVYTALKSAKPGNQSFVDFAPQKHADGRVLAYIGQPVFESNDSTGGINVVPKRLGTLVLALDAEFLNRSLFYNGQKGSMSMIIGGAGDIISSLNDVPSHMRIADAKSALGLRKDGMGIGYGTSVSAAGEGVLVAVKQIDAADSSKWIVAHMRSEKQAFLLRDDILSKLVKFSAIAMIPGVFLAVLIGWSLVRPISGLARALTNIADGRLQDEVPSQGRSDEIGDIANAVHTIRTKLEAEAAIREREQEEVAAEAGVQRNLLMNDLADDLDRTIAAIATSVSASAEELNVTARELEAGAIRGQDSSATVNTSAPFPACTRSTDLPKICVKLSTSLIERCNCQTRLPVLCASWRKRPDVSSKGLMRARAASLTSWC